MEVAKTTTDTPKGYAQPDGCFTKKIGNTCYEVAVFFSRKSKQTLEDKVKRLIVQDVQNGDF